LVELFTFIEIQLNGLFLKGKLDNFRSHITYLRLERECVLFNKDNSESEKLGLSSTGLVTVLCN